MSDLDNGKLKAAFVVTVEVALEVGIEVFEHQVELVAAADHIFQTDNVSMVQLLEQGDLTDCGAGYAVSLTGGEREGSRGGGKVGRGDNSGYVYHYVD